MKFYKRDEKEPNEFEPIIVKYNFGEEIDCYGIMTYYNGEFVYDISESILYYNSDDLGLEKIPKDIEIISWAFIE